MLFGYDIIQLDILARTPSLPLLYVVLQAPIPLIYPYLSPLGVYRSGLPSLGWSAGAPSRKIVVDLLRA